MPYSGNSLAACIVGAVVGVVAIANLAYSARVYHSFRNSPQGKAGGASLLTLGSSRAALPAAIHLTFLLSNVFASACSICSIVLPWMWATGLDDNGTPLVSVNSWLQADLTSLFRPEQVLCTAFSKAGTAAYVLAKMLGYLFFFLKQRAVRPLSHPSRLEKLVFVLTLGIGVFAAIVAILSQGDANTLDGSCQLHLPIWTLIVMAIADISLSSLYLYLFIEPLRATIRANQAVRRITAIYTENATEKNKTAMATAPVLNTALEAVMRKNTYSCIVTVVVSSISMMFMLASHVSGDGSYTRKWVVCMGQTDILVSALALSHIMHKSSATTAPAPVAGAAATDLEMGRKVSGRASAGSDHQGIQTETSAAHPPGNGSLMVPVRKTSSVANSAATTPVIESRRVAGASLDNFLLPPTGTSAAEVSTSAARTLSSPTQQSSTPPLSPPNILNSMYVRASSSSSPPPSTEMPTRPRLSINASPNDPLVVVDAASPQCQLQLLSA